MGFKAIIFCEIFFLLFYTIMAQNYWTNQARMPSQNTRTKTAGNPYPQMQIQTRAETTTEPPPRINPFYEFNRKLFYILGPPFAQNNMIFSPFSLQTLLAFIYTGADGQTAQELRECLEIPAMLSEVARLFQDHIYNIKSQTSEDLKFNMINNMYYNYRLGIDYDFYTRSKPYFEAEVEPINFAAPAGAADKINRMIAGKTENRIRNLIRPDTLDSDTQAILVNAIYLKAKWAKQFSISDTQMENFKITKSRAVPAQMMYMEEEFNVGVIPGLNAKAIDLPFKDSQLSMMIILPNDIDGLAKLEVDLGRVDLNSLSSLLSPELVRLLMPKFKFEFDVDMTAPLMSCGVQQLFSDNAQLGGFFSNQTVRISKIQHKAFINVNEGGVEAAAASFGKLLPLSLPFKMTYFTIDHPFVFLIRSPYAVYFVGHVVRP